MLRSIDVRLYFCFQVFHLEDIVEETGYVLEKDSEYSQKILEEEEEVSISVTQKGGKTLQHQVLCRVSILHALLIPLFMAPLHTHQHLRWMVVYLNHHKGLPGDRRHIICLSLS